MTYTLSDVNCVACGRSFKILNVKERNFCKLACREAFYRTSHEKDPNGIIDWRRIIYNVPLSAKRLNDENGPEAIEVATPEISDLSLPKEID